MTPRPQEGESSVAQDFIMPLKMAHHFKCIACLLLEFSICSQLAIATRSMEGRVTGQGEPCGLPVKLKSD